MDIWEKAMSRQENPVDIWDDPVNGSMLGWPQGDQLWCKGGLVLARLISRLPGQPSVESFVGSTDWVAAHDRIDAAYQRRDPAELVRALRHFILVTVRFAAQLNRSAT